MRNVFLKYLFGPVDGILVLSWEIGRVRVFLVPSHAIWCIINDGMISHCRGSPFIHF